MSSMVRIPDFTSFIYGMDGGDPKVIAVIPGSGRTDGGINHAKIERGLLRVELT